MILLITFVTSIFTIVQEIGYCDFNNEFTRMLLESNYLYNFIDATMDFS